ncbi:MAG: hypothetical protein AB1633_08750, partial [Elusimicrobiota bacterium]
MIKTSICILLLTIIGVCSWEGGAGLDVTDMEIGARAIGMGMAHTSVSNDGFSIYWNPAGLGNISRYQFSSFSAALFSEQSFYYLALSGAIKSYGIICAAWSQFVSSEIESTIFTDSSGDIRALPDSFQNYKVTGTYKSEDNVLTFAYGLHVS